MNNDIRQSLQWKKAHDTIEVLKNTSGTKDKQNILLSLEGEEQDFMKQILYYTYNSNLIYNIGKAKVKGLLELPFHEELVISEHESIFQYLEYLAGLSGITDEILSHFIKYITSHPLMEYRETVLNIILKDLRIGMNIKSINKVFPNLLPQFDLQLARKYADRVDKIVGEEIAITLKMDGVRGAIIIDYFGNIKIKSRQNKEIIGCNEITKALGSNLKLPKGVVLDGELIYNGKEELSSADRYRKTMEIVGSKDPDKKDLDFKVFDIIDLRTFNSQGTTPDYNNRRDLIEEIFTSSLICEVSPLVQPVQLFYKGVFDSEIVSNLLQEVLDKGEEGLMINLVKAPYEFKRTNNLLKLKALYSVDLKVVGFERGEEGKRNENTLGALIVDYKGNEVGVGTGFSDSMRNEIWANRENIIGKIVEIEYTEESNNKDNDALSLRFPRFISFRNDKDDVSYD